MAIGRRIGVLAVVASLLVQTGCFTVEAVAPYGPDVELLPPGTPVEVSRRFQKWYAIFGIFDLSGTNDVRDVIARERLVQVRVYTEDAAEDSVSGFFYTLLFPTGILLPQMVVVEGNRAPGDPGPTPAEPPPAR